MSTEINSVSNSDIIYEACVELTDKIRGSMYNVAREFVYIGFLLAECEYYQSYRDWGYSSIHEYASHQLGFKKSSTYNFINVCKTFCQPTNALPFSYFMKEPYSSFNFSQLCEMLSMSDKQRSQVTSDMSVKQIREVKKLSDEPDYITLFNQQIKFKEFRYEFIKKIDGKKFRLLIKGLKVDVSDSWPDGYMLSIDTDFGDSGSGSGYQPFVDYEKFKELIISKIPVSRRLETVPEEASASDSQIVQQVDFDLLEPFPSDVYDLFNDIEEASLSASGIDSRLYDIAMQIFSERGYVLYRKVKSE